MDQAVELRRQADDLLCRLLATREQTERRLAETGHRDPIKAVTGQSAYDEAIRTTRDMIHRMDDLLGEMNDELAHTQIQVTTPHYVLTGDDREG